MTLSLGVFHSLFSVVPTAFKISDFSVSFWKLGSWWKKYGNIRFAFPATFQIKSNVEIYSMLHEKMIKDYYDGIFENIMQIWQSTSIRDLEAIFFNNFSR